MVTAAPPTPRAISLQDVADAVTRYYGITVEDLRTADRSAMKARPRQVYMYLSREMTPARLRDIGDFIEREHTTCYTGWENISKLKATDTELAYDIGVIASEIRTVVGAGAPDVMECVPPMKFFYECEVETGRYMFDLTSLRELMQERDIPSRAWVTSVYIHGNQIRYTFRWSNDRAEG